MATGTIFYDPSRPLYEFTEKGHRDQGVVADRIQMRVAQAIKGKPVNDATKKFLREEIKAEYEALEKDGYIEKVKPRDVKIRISVEEANIEVEVENAP